jgi:peptide/nickel transport system substrate-binding protein
LFAGVAATATGTEQALRGGTVIVGSFEPPNLNVFRHDSAPALWIGHMVILGAFSVDPRGVYVPNLIAGEPRITMNPFSLTYAIDPRARWSDGVPVSARDFVFTWQASVNPNIDIDPVLRAGYETISSARILGPKRVRFVFDKPYAEWKTLFDFVLPWHALRAQDINDIWRDAIDDPRTGTSISDGPFVFESWSRNDELTLTRNNRYWRKKPYLSGLTFRFLPDAASQVTALRARQVDLVLPPPTALTPADVRNERGFRVASGPLNIWEHLDFNFGPNANPTLRDPFVRRAIADAIDRNALVHDLAASFLPGLKPLQNAFVLPLTPAYKRHWQMWRYNPRAATALLRSHGCGKGLDGIFSCGGERLSFRFTTTAGNPMRQLAFERIQAQLEHVGIELQGDFEPAPLAFQRIQKGDWDISLFSWENGPDPTSGDVDIFRCHGPLNYNAYCNARVSALLTAASAAVRSGARAALLNRADELAAKDIPLLPLYAKVGYVLYNSRIRNVVWNPDVDHFVFWNAEKWWIGR